MIKKITVLLFLLVFASTTFAANQQELKTKVVSKVKSYYKSLVEKYENGNLKKEEISERIRNRINVLKEMYGDKLSDDFYKKMKNIADQINTIHEEEKSRQQVEDSKNEVMEESKQAKEKTMSKATEAKEKAQKKYKVAKDHKEKIDTVLNKFFGKLSNTSKQAQIGKVKVVLKKIRKKSAIVEKMKNETAKSKLMGILNYIEDKFEDKLQELK